MGYTTGVQWTNRTHNFWYGCKKVSAGCKFCYAERDMERYGRDFHTVTRAKGFDTPLNWKEPALVFVNSWSDFFISDADEWRNDAWDVIRKTQHLIYQILTKRPENIKDRLPPDWGNGWGNVWLGVSAENQMMADKRIPILLSIPAILGATVLELSDLEFTSPINRPIYLVGFLSSFIFGLLSLKFFSYVIKKAKLEFFAYYCFILGGMALLLYN